MGCGVTTGVDTTFPICLSDITTSLIYGKTAIAIAAAREHSLVLTSTGGAYAFGQNSQGQFGDNTIIDKNYPVAINFLECSITFDATNKGLIDSAQTKVFNLIKDDPITPPTVTPNAGWSFTGWSPSVPATASGADATYTAQYTPNQYSITFNANGGTPSPASKSVIYLSTYDTLATASLTGYTFAGWWTTISGGTEITASSTVTITSAQTLYAHWTINNYTITWAANGGSGGGANSCDHGTTPTPISAGAKANYHFTGWTPTIVAATGNTTYTAVWVINSYFKGDVNGDGTISVVDALMTLQAATKKIILTPGSNAFFAADVNSSETVTALDALKILQYLSGRISNF